MPITHYELFNGLTYSLAGEKYDVKIFSEYKLTGVGNLPMTVDEDRPLTLGKISLNYDTAEQDKFSTIIASKLELEVFVATADGGAMKKFTELLRDKWEEGNVTVAIWKNNREFWAGTMLIDLGDEEDTVPPYAVTLTATDGIGLLKNYDMVSTQAANPYDPADTYLSEGYKSVIHWLSVILNKCRIPLSDQTSGQWTDYTIDASVLWAYEHQNMAVGDCTLRWTELQMLGCYALQDSGTYKCPTVYYVLETICKMFNMRLVYFSNTFFFTQINEFNTSETGTTGNPVNIPTSSFDLDGVFVAARESIQPDQYFGNYEQEISFGNDGGLQRLSGGNFTYEPQVKRVECTFDSFVGSDSYYQGFPEVWTTAEVNSSSGDIIHTTPLGTHYNASTFGGFICEFPLDITHTNPLGLSNFFAQNFTIRARQVGTAWSDGKIMIHSANATPHVGEWVDYPTTTAGNLNYEYIMGVVASAPNVLNWWQQIGFNVKQYPDGLTSDEIIFNHTINIDPAFTGDWEFEIMMQGRALVVPTYSVVTYYFMGVALFLNWPNPPAPTTFAAIYEWLEDGIEMTWVDSMDNTTTPATYKGTFQPFSSSASSAGATSQVIQVYSSRTDTEIKKVEPIIWGDTITFGESNSILFADSNGVLADGYTDPNGLWAFEAGAAIFDMTITTMICQDRLNNQGISSENMNATIARSIVNPTDPTIGWNIFVNPIGILRDSDTGLTYQFHRGTYNLNSDEVEGEWMQTTRATVGSTTTTTGGGQSDDNGPSQSARMGNPYANGNILRADICRLSAAVTAGTITSLPIDQTYVDLTALRQGDILALNIADYGGTNYVTLSSDVLRTDTTLSIDSFALPVSLLAGTGLSYSEADVVYQSMHKTHGTVAGFDIDADGIAKGGVEITGWLDSDTMTGATANNVPTAESVKAYVDASGGGSTQNFAFCDCTGTALTSATNGEALAVVIPYDTKQTESTINNVSLNGSGGVEGVSGGEYSFSMNKTGFWEITWNVCSNTSVQNNRILSGVKLQSGTVEGEAITWSDLDPSHSYIYDRGTGSVRKGSTANQFILRQSSIVETTYYRIVIWREAGTHASTKSITVVNGTNLIIKEI